MKILVVVAHGRANSLTRQVAEAFALSAREKGHEVEVADLVKERFDPVLTEVDEPDWNDPDKTYSEAVRREMARIERNEATVMVFPVWWWSMPAILKGWIDRVWNHGWAYGPRSYPHKRVLMIAIAGNGRETYEKRDYDKAMQLQLATGILDYCGVEDGRLETLYGAIEGNDAPNQILHSASALGAAF
ncbi:MAG: NAD(P)H oxidoreductase [Proteobacteria bacterium]|nr:NAD(P)H oxidoreductase [Pseudomonadota bacterium]